MEKEVKGITRFSFVEKENDGAAVTIEYIKKVESDWGIEFPAILKEYFLQHNGADIRECRFEKFGLEFCVVEIFDLNYGTFPLETLVTNCKSNEAISDTLIPLALDEDEDNYYWDSADGKVYYLSLENVEHPKEICGSVEEFFEILETSQGVEVNTGNPNYVLRTNEAVLMPIKKNKGKNILKICILVIVAVIILGSFIFQDNLFAELSWSVRIFLVMLVIGFGFYEGEKEYTPSPMELQFYDDRLILHLPKRYYSNWVTRKQINTMKYSDISKCVYKAKSNRIHIYGDGSSVWYNYKKDGSLPLNPTKKRNFKQGLIYFNTRLATGIDFIKEIEEHSPLIVIIEDD